MLRGTIRTTIWTAEQAETESLSAKQGFAARAAVYLVMGIVMLVLSAI